MILVGGQLGDGEADADAQRRHQGEGQDVHQEEGQRRPNLMMIKESDSDEWYLHRLSSVRTRFGGRRFVCFGFDPASAIEQLKSLPEKDCGCRRRVKTTRSLSLSLLLKLPGRSCNR